MAVIGHGIDIIEIDRIKEAKNKWGERFLGRIFTAHELDYARRKKYLFQHLAARFAAKEAIVKAFGELGNETIPWKDIEISNLSDGRPVVKLTGEARKFKSKNKIKEIVLSLAHSKYYAVASAILIG